MDVRNIISLLVLFITSHLATSQVTAAFVFDKSEGCGSLAVTFTDQSTSVGGTINDWKWDLGGVISTKQNPGIIFTTPGQFTICLTVRTTTGATSTICKDKIIKIYENPVANFTVDAQTGCLPVQTTFQDLSTSKNGAISIWVWDVGGSTNLLTTSDSSQIIRTTYTTAGNYSATLSITDEKGCKSTINKPNLIQVTALPEVKLDYTLLNSCNLPWDIVYTNLNLDPDAKYSWDFGNGQKHVGPIPPAVKYQESKAYTVKVFVEKGPCSDTLFFENIVNTERKTDFYFKQDGLCAGQIIELIDSSNYTGDSLVWDFGDGFISRDKKPVHQYATAGCYTIKLKKYLGPCLQEISKPCVNILPAPNIAFNIKNAFSCVIPVKVEFEASSQTQGTFEWHVKGMDLDTVFLGTNHDLTITEYGNYLTDLAFRSVDGCKVDIKNEPLEINQFEIELNTFGPDGCVPFNVPLKNSVSSNIPISEWSWQVGNPVIFTSLDSNAVFSVSDTGTWDLRLIAKNIFGCVDTVTKPRYIQGGRPPQVNFSASPLQGCIMDGRQFTSQTSAFADEWLWTYNDTTFFSEEKDPLFSFPDIGVFDITLTASHHGCARKFEIKDYITVFKPKSAFAVDYSCTDPYTIAITNQSVGADSLYWVIKLSETVTDTIRDSLLTTYTFPERGLYFLTHYAKNFNSGCEHILTDSIFIVDLSASYTLDTIRGCAPLEVNLSSTVRDAVSSEFLPGQFSITDPTGDNATVIFNEGGTIQGPKLVVTDRHGCRDTFQTQTPVEVSKINARIDAPDVICIPGSATLFDGSSYGVAAITSRTWYFSHQDQRDTILSPQFNISDEGIYFATLSLKDSWGCSDSVTREVKAVKLIPAFSADTLSCTDKAVRFKIDADPTFLNKFQWDFGDGSGSTEKNPLHFFETEGSFDVCAELFDVRGCSKKLCQEKLVVIKNPIAAFDGDPLTGPCPPLLSNFNNYSTNATRFTWNFGDNSGLSYNNLPSHVYNQPGNDDVTLYAEMIPGCVDTLHKIDFIRLLGPSANMNYSLSGNCLPLDITLSVLSDKPYEYIWDYGDGKIFSVPDKNTEHSTTYRYEESGKFVPKLLVSDENGCSRTFTIDPIEVNDIQSSFTFPPDPLCGLPVHIEINNQTTATSPALHYFWNITGSATYASTDKNPVFDIDNFGKFDISLISILPNCIDTLIKDSVLFVSPIPKADFDIRSSILCNNYPLEIENLSTISTGSISSYLWKLDNVVTSPNVNFNPKFNTPGTHSIQLKVSTENGCADSITRSITLLPNTLITLTEDKTICLGDSTDLMAMIVSSDNNYLFKWNNHPTIMCPECKTNNVKPDKTTVYYLETLSSAGCVNKDSVIITVLPIAGPQLKLSSDTIVCEKGSATIKILNFNPLFVYKWDEKDAGLDCYTDCSTVRATPDEDTYYSILVSNAFGCLKEDSILVRVEKNIADFLLSDKTICEGQSTELSVTGGNNPVWSAHPSLSCSQCLTPTAHPSQSQYYTVTVTSDAGCRYKDSIWVELISVSSIDAGSDALICKGETISLVGKGSGGILWTSDASIDNPQSLNISSRPDQSTTYILTATNDECVLHDTIYVKVILKTDVFAIGDTICPGQQAMVKAKGNADTFVWYENKLKVGTGDTLVIRPESSLFIDVIGSKGLCLPDTATISVLVYPEIDYHLIEDSYKLFINSKIKVLAGYNPDADYTYKWTPTSGLSCNDCPQPEIQDISQSGQYTVSISDHFGCMLDANLYVSLTNECSKNGFYIPNIFTPYNRDGKNDTFKVYAEQEAEFISISIFDRWGEKVFTSADINEKWDGLYKGNELAHGVYVYIITARCDKTNEIFNFAGDITIIE